MIRQLLKRIVYASGLLKSFTPLINFSRYWKITNAQELLQQKLIWSFSLQPTRHSKLEKADILEMTVKHLQTIQRQQLNTAVATDPAVLTKFRSGFSECATEVSRYVNHLENVDPAVKQRLVAHLNSCVNNLQQVAPFYSHYVPYMPERLYPEIKVGFQNDFQNGDENNNDGTRIQIPSGVPLIPSRLVTGELALLVPQSAGLSSKYSFFPPAQETSRVHPSSAFTAVKRPHSPLVSPTTSTSSFDDNHHSEAYQNSQSPKIQNRFKVPDCSSTSSKSTSSPETQKAQVSSTSDSNSPRNSFAKRIQSPTVHLEVATESIEKLRQPLSVITDKAYNSRSSNFGKKEGFKRHNSDGLLTISEKRPKYSEIHVSLPMNSSSFDGPVKHSFANTAEDLSGKASSSNAKEHRYEEQYANAESIGVNNDMWRPW